LADVLIWEGRDFSPAQTIPLLTSGTMSAGQRRIQTVKEMSRATYRAEQFPEAVVVFATGVHHETGYRVSFERVGVTVFPPQFSFMHQRPEGNQVQSLTPFAHCVAFETDRKVEAVVIYDADGRHVIEVRQVSERKPAGAVV